VESSSALSRELASHDPLTKSSDNSKTSSVRYSSGELRSSLKSIPARKDRGVRASEEGREEGKAGSGRTAGA